MKDPPRATPDRNTLERALIRINESTRPAGTSPAPAEAHRAALIDALRILEPHTSPSTAINIEALEAQLDLLLDHPSSRLAIYGSLAPGRINHHVIADVPGTWHDGCVRGSLTHVGWGSAHGFPALAWDPLADPVPVKLLDSPQLTEHWSRLDEFEGAEYRRLLVTVEFPDSVRVANLYGI